MFFALLNTILFIAMLISCIIWVYFKFHTSQLVRKYNLQDYLPHFVAETKRLPLPTHLFQAALTFVIIFAIYAMFGLILFALAAFLIFITLGGIAFREAGGDPTIYNFILALTGIYFTSIPYCFYIIYIIVALLLFRSLYIVLTICHTIETGQYRQVVTKITFKQAKNSQITSQRNRKNTFITIGFVIIIILLQILRIVFETKHNLDNL